MQDTFVLVALYTLPEGDYQTEIGAIFCSFSDGNMQ